MILDTLNYKFNLYTEEPEAYIITLKDNEKSERESQRCVASCNKIGQKSNIWQAFCVKNDNIIYPDHLKDQDHFKFLKLKNTLISPMEVCCLLSHYSLWAHCVKIDKPIIILEHDAVMIKKYEKHKAFNQICYLGCFKQFEEGGYNEPPILNSLILNYFYMHKAHAYAIDPLVAKQMVSHIIKFGITVPADMFIRPDLFNITQNDLYAYEISDIRYTTITDREPIYEAWKNDINIKDFMNNII